MVIIKLCLSAAILPRPLPWTRETLEEEWEDPEPGRNLAFGVVTASRAAESLGVRGGHEENWAEQLRDGGE